MQLRPDFQISTMITALSDVIIPAVDPKNRLASEQAQLVLGMLNLMASQLPVQFRFDCDELRRLLRAAEQLKPHLAAQTEALGALEATAGAAADVLARCQGSPAELLEAIRAMRREIGAAVTAAPVVVEGPAPPVVVEGPAAPAVMEGPAPPAVDEGPAPPAVDEGPAPPAVDEGPAAPVVVEGPALPAVGAAFTEAELVVLRMSREQLLRDRALLAPQNWETGVDALPPLEELLAEG